MSIDKFRRQVYIPKLNVGGLDVYSAMGIAAIQGTVYYVEGNAGLDTNDGLSWEKAFKTLTVALAASHANIAAGSSGWAARNTIYCKGDSLDEDLTKFAQKTDVVGVGSCADVPCCRITGTHVLEAQSVADYMGCHFYNFEFQDDGASVNITIPADQNGIEFHNCLFTATASGTYAIKATSVYGLRIIGCKFLPNRSGTKFATAAIWLAGTTIADVQIIGNIIYGAIGIKIGNTNVHGGIIGDNLIVATTLVIDDDSDDFVIVNNRLVSAAAKATLGNVLDYNAALAVDNILTGSDGTIHCPSESA